MRKPDTEPEVCRWLEAQDDLFDEAHDLFDDALCPFCGSGHITSAKENVYHCDNCGKWYEYEYE